jgi:protein-L-isoaspartate O-methyltransferase
VLDRERWSREMVARVLEGRYERQERKTVRNCVEAGDNVVEIGGGIGLIALIASDTVDPGHIHVFEANPDLCELAKLNSRIANAG